MAFGTTFGLGCPSKAQSRPLTLPLDALPVYVRGGTILPEQPLVQNTDELPQGPLQISVYPGPNCQGSLYQDDGNTMAYRRGEFLRIGFTCESDSSALRLNSTTAHSGYKPWWNSWEVVIFSVERKPKDVKVNHASVPNWRFDPVAHTVRVTLRVLQPDVEVLVDR